MDSACSTSPETCATGDDSSNNLVVYATAAMTTLGTMGLSTIMLMQLDGISRRMLSPPRLMAKRRQEYKYTVEQSSEYNSLMIRQHIGGGKSVYDPKIESTLWENLTKNDTNEMDEVIVYILNAKKATPVIVAMEQELGDDDDPNTYYLYLGFPPSREDGDVGTPVNAKFYSRRVRVPLVDFCEKLANAYEGQMTSTTLCFMADASAGMGSEMLTTVVKRSNHGVATISNPAWMTTLSLLISQRSKTNNITTQQFERIIFSLCRLDAWRVRSSVGKSKTVLFALPGQSCTPLLLPLIQKVFVHERHVFVYDGACYSVQTGTALRKQYGASYRQNASKPEWDEVSASPTVITSTFPMTPIRYNRELPNTLANLNGIQASVVEAWMSSVDTFLEMKAKERKNFYTPFVCRMGFLMKRSGIGNGYGSDMSEIALKNMLEYVTGSKSRALPEEVMKEAVKCMLEMRSKFEDMVKGSELDAAEKILVEKCVFTHKSILIGEKTLLDTVKPQEDWSLKAAKKLKSCMCCIPGEEDEEEDSDDEDDGGNEDGGASSKEPEDKRKSLSAPGAFATNNRSKYIDGKAQFAFDPTMFNK